MNDNELKILDYTLFRVDSYSRHTGGVACYVHSSVSIEVIDSFDRDDIWSLSFKITSGYKQDSFCVVYRGHKSNISDFTSFLNRTIDLLSVDCQNFHIVGDFNYNYNDKTVSKSLRNLLTTYSLRQIVKSPTREYKTANTLIDWVVTNSNSIGCQVVSENIIADHNFIAINLFGKNRASTNKSISRVDWSGYSKAKLTEFLASIDWHSFDVLDNVNGQFNFMHENFQMFFGHTLRTKVVTAKSSIKWFTHEHAELKQQKIEAKIKWNKSKSDCDWKTYTKLRNRYKSSLRNSERNYLQAQLSLNLDDPKKLWTILKSIYGNDDKPALTSLTFDDSVEHDGQKCADLLNEYFINSIVLLSSSVPCVSKDLRFYVRSSPSQFSFQQVTSDHVRSLVNEFKAKYYNDNLTGKVMLDAIATTDFLISFTAFINTSLEHGLVPDLFKNSTVTPVQKVANSTKVSDLRPINMLPVCSQILERIVKDQLLDHFESNSLFATQQSGFRKFHSCESSLALVVSDWIDALDRNKIVIAVFLDLKRAFETVDRQLLLRKLELYGCDPIVLGWFSSYLHNRFQRTKFNSYFSSLLPIIFGIPQGSVLSCLLFVIFMNDIVNVVEHCRIKLFADDTLIYIECDPEKADETIARLNADLKKIFDWLCFSKLSINVEKTKAMVINKRRSVPILSSNVQINDQKIEMVDSIKYLGIIIDSGLTFQEQHETMLRKLNKKFFLFKRCEPKMNYESKKLFVQSLVFSHFNYCSSISFLFNDTQIDDFQKIVNRFMRVILRCDNQTHRQDMLDSFGWLSVKQLLNLNVILFFRRIIVFESPTYLFFKLRKIASSHRYPTRRGDEYILPNYTKAFSQNSLFYKGLQLYNEFLNYRKEETTQAPMKLMARDFVKSKFHLT